MSVREDVPKPASVLVHIDRREGGPLQRQICEGLRRHIAEGVLSPGTRLPSSRRLADDLAVSRVTTSGAYEQLESEGYLTSKRGSGTFVTLDLSNLVPVPSACPAPRGDRPSLLSQRGEALAVLPPPALRAPGPPVPFRLGSPAVDLFPIQSWSELARRRYRRVSAARLDYSDLAGVPALREAIAEHLQAARGTRCSAEQIVIVAGAQRGMELLFQTLLDPGDEAWLEEPGYTGARSALFAAGARAVPVPVDAEGLDVAAGLARAPEARLAFVTPSHQFPLGVVMSERRRRELLAWASGRRAWIVEDDYDSEFRYGTAPVPCLHGLDTQGCVAYLGTFSKSLFPSLRLGFIVAPADYCEKLVKARLASDVQPAYIEQAILADFIGEGHFDNHLRRMRALYAERLDALVQAARRACGGVLSLRPVRAGMHVAAELIGVDAGRVFLHAQARRLEVMPLSTYYSGGGPRANGLILGFGACSPDANSRGMDQLAQAIEAARA
jgi:GntR family transcriptional regulator/MocR family aminotransferase